MQRHQFKFQGRIQGVGFRPLVCKLASELGLSGWVKNTAEGVTLELQGINQKISEFEMKLRRELVTPALIRQTKKQEIELKNEEVFQIFPSETSKYSTAEVMPDLALCAECERELTDPSNRRFRYPFVHCAQCGPRYSILKRLPFDRINTTMVEFDLCKECRDEYENPTNRRFHCQSICCGECGPSLSMKDALGNILHEEDSALREAAQKIREGQIVAILGIGGFHLVCDARNGATVARLREKKRRKAKPFAVMAPDLRSARDYCYVSPLEEQILKSPGAPIVLLRSKDSSHSLVSGEVAPGIGTLGVMLPYSPLHRLLMDDLAFPVVATSGNLSEEPICYDEGEAFSRLNGLADYFLVHNRKIASRVDDSVVRVIAGTEVVFRAGRGYAPLVLDTSTELADVLALGTQQKNTLAFSNQGRIVLMPHIGSLDSLEAEDAYRCSLEKVHELRSLSYARVVCDLHPDYHSTQVGAQLTRDSNLQPVQIQHHKAHLFSCIAEQGIRGPIFGIAWDGTGFGPDGTVWGGEFFIGSEDELKRSGHLRTFALPGAHAAIREPKRVALALLYEIEGLACLRHARSLGIDEREALIYLKLIEQKVNSPRTSSAGRLFDGVAELLGICGRSDYEGQAACELEYLAASHEVQESYPVQVLSELLLVVDWRIWIRRMIEDRDLGLAPGWIAAKFHRTLAHAIVEMAKRARVTQVVLSGGCFQNRLLSEWAIEGLLKAGFTPFWNQKVPPNDGGVSVGQVWGGGHVLIRSR